MAKAIKFKGKVESFFNWEVEQIILYGDPWIEWWKTKGTKDFLEFAKKRGIEYIKIKRKEGK